MKHILDLCNCCSPQDYEPYVAYLASGKQRIPLAIFQIFLDRFFFMFGDEFPSHTIMNKRTNEWPKRVGKSKRERGGGRGRERWGHYSRKRETDYSDKALIPWGSVTFHSGSPYPIVFLNEPYFDTFLWKFPWTNLPIPLSSIPISKKIGLLNRTSAIYNE